MVTDFHSHILPGIDDGSPDAAQSLAMLRVLAAQGIERVVLTPHFYPRYDDPDTFLTARAQSAAILRSAMAGEEGLPRLTLGAEVHYFPGISDSEVLPRLALAGTSCILIEMPPAPWTPQMFRELNGIQEKQGLTPILAHIDRYITPLHTYGIFRQLEELPVLVQANAGFFLDRKTARFALRLLREGKIHVLGSDCHNLTDRAPNLGPAAAVIRQRLGEGTLLRIGRTETEILAD